jgi:hypothetical protein
MDLEKYVKITPCSQCCNKAKGQVFLPYKLRLIWLVGWVVCLFVCLCFFWKEKKFRGGFFVFGNLVGPPFGARKRRKKGGVGKEGKGVPIMCKVISVRLHLGVRALLEGSLM